MKISEKYLVASALMRVPPLCFSRRTAVWLISLSIVFISTGWLSAGTSGVRGAYSRGGMVGAHNVAMGYAVEAITDDVFSIYWNPAGLTNLRQRKRSIREDVRINLQQKRIDKITEHDLEQLSDNTPKFFLQVGASASMLDEEREAAFTGLAFNIYNAVVGIGIYTIYSDEIETYDTAGSYQGQTSYQGAVSYFSFAYPAEFFSFGVNTKILYESIDETNYAGSAFDFGVQTDFIPLIQLGAVIQDIGIGLKPINEQSDISNEYEFGKPLLRLNIALLSRNSTFVLSAGLIRAFEDSNNEYKLGIMYKIYKNASFLLGIKETLLSTGMKITILGTDLSYALSVDNIDFQYNHTVSFSILF